MRRNAKMSQSEPILGFTPATGEKTEEKVQTKVAWEKEAGATKPKRSKRGSHQMPPMRIGNLLPRLELEPVVNGIKVGDTNGAVTKQRKGKRSAMSPKQLKRSLKAARPETILRPQSSPTSPQSLQTAFAVGDQIF